MDFVKCEVEGEQKIAMAMSGFGLTKTSPAKNHDKKWDGEKHHTPTAAGLLTTSKGLTKHCIFCSGSHKSQECRKAHSMPLTDRRRAVEETKACFCCLRVGHAARVCRNRPKCAICQRAHHPIVCDNSANNKVIDKSMISSEKPKEPIRSEALASLATPCKVLMQTILVKIKGKNYERNARALIDSASQRSYVLDRTAREMGYESTKSESIQHALFGGINTKVTDHQVFTISLSTLDENYSCHFDALSHPKICNNISRVTKGPWLDDLAKMNIVISDTESDGPIEILIGADVAGKLLTSNHRVMDCGLVAIQTKLGWTLMGKMPTKERSSAMVTTSMLVQQLKISDLWTLDMLGIRDPLEQKSEEEVQKEVGTYFMDTVGVDDGQRYVVRLPWVEGHPPLQDNYDLCIQRLNSTIKKLTRDQLTDTYEQVFLEWLNEDIIEEVPPFEVSKPCHYLPHRHVLKENSTTKIRPVFDASAHEKGIPALNECLYKGLNLIEQIPSVLIRFRADSIGVSADIKKAFLQIKLHESDKNFMRFLWRTGDGELKHFRHCRVVFGVLCSPFLLGATLKHLLSHSALCLSPEFHETTERLKRSFYVDNCLTSLPSMEEAQAFRDQAQLIMEQRKFDLRGWEFSHSLEDKTCPVLGLAWNTKSDTLSLCRENLEFEVEKVTKRVILSLTNRVFDPIGFTCPVVLLPKLLLQRSWAKKLSWEEEVDSETKQQFQKWLGELLYLVDIKIPRCLNNVSGLIIARSLHVFCDASQAAYGAVVFLRVETEEEVKVNLIQAKSRVAPLKGLSIPRLELLAALIGARLHAKIAVEFGERPTQSVFWSDSTTVLAWIQRQEQWGTFVANRVKEIVDLTKDGVWRHVPGNQNPADLPSRGCLGRKLSESCWWEGPEWLRNPSTSWPSKDAIENEEEISFEKKKGVSMMLALQPDDWYYRYFSKYQQIVRMVAWMYRFIFNASKKTEEERRKGDLSGSEYQNAELMVIKLVQQESFEGETDKSITSLCPFSEKDGIIRLRSKIAWREGEIKDFRYPMILPAHHPVIKRLILFKHIEACHVGTQGLMSIIRERYWILGGRRTVRSVVKGCTICRRYDAKRIETGPVALPSQRVRDASAFEISGIDLAGPLYLREGKKAWVCLFTCATYRAVHLELITSLSTDSFLQGFRRFVARRGRPSVVYTDNGLNFVGADNAFKNLDWKRIVSLSSIKQIEWRFNPPAAPWWGGWWERMVGVVKRLLRRVLAKATLCHEELATILCDCEAVVNSRPITYLAESPEDLTPLTPSMFIQGIREVGLPECDLVDADDFRKRIKYRQKIYNDLRKRFRSEYLGMLRQYYKKVETRPLEVGEIVLVGNDNRKRITWPLGCVTELIPGRDGVVRLVRLRTSTGQLLRPVQRLYPLEVKSTSEETCEISEKGLSESEVISEKGLSESEVEDVNNLKDFKDIVTRRGRKVIKPIRIDL